MDSIEVTTQFVHVRGKKIAADRELRQRGQEATISFDGKLFLMLDYPALSALHDAVNQVMDEIALEDWHAEESK